MRRIHVPRSRIQGDRAHLEPAEEHYLRDVLRLAAGARLEVFDGEGGLHEAALGEGGALALGPRREVPPPRATVWLAFAPPRGDRADLVVQKATELGAARLLPFEAERSVVRLDVGRGAARAERWRRIAADAARQCGRAEVPAVDAPASLAAVLGVAPPGFRTVVFYEGGGEPLAAVLDPAAPGHLAVVGPEGGFTSAEVEACAAAGARLATLGPRVLRAETAALVATALLQHRLGDLGGEG
jgi:16S rRNA (uracil1498-N3)-methyltransferase